MKIKYIDWNPTPAIQEVVYQANQIIEEYENQGYILTLRQLYYQFVARNLIPNNDKSYKSLGKTITKARMAGLVSWNAIEDRNRGINSYYFEEDERQPIRSLPALIQFDQWERQTHYVEVWVEKEALGNVVARACEPLQVPFMSCKGYLSASEAWRAGQRYAKKIDEGKECILIHLGDHDPSGLDMTRDNSERVDIFTQVPGFVDVQRIALNMDQVRKFQPPTNPTKLSDVRAKNYIREYGYDCWELDALEPSTIEGIIKEKVESYIDWDWWYEVIEMEKNQKALLARVYDRWDDIKPMLEV